MFSIRNIGGVSLFLFGTTFLWLTPMYAAAGTDTSGVAWAMTTALAFEVIVSFAVATYGLFRRTAWWERLATASAIMGFAALVPYWVAADASGVADPPFDVAIHALGCAGVLVLLRVPRLEHWVNGHVVAGR
jgi:peptidoglycan/LPS O-acetylase OafA/YrhL